MSQLSGAIRTIRPVTATLIWYARCSTEKQDVEAHRQALLGLGRAELRAPEPRSWRSSAPGSWHLFLFFLKERDTQFA
jgi:hypothetical protein